MKVLPSTSTSSTAVIRKHVVKLEAFEKERYQLLKLCGYLRWQKRTWHLETDNTPSLFQKMFPGSSISKFFTMSRVKASYILQDGLGPLLSKWLCKKLCDSESGFMLMFDETTMVQKQK